MTGEAPERAWVAKTRELRTIAVEAVGRFLGAIHAGPNTPPLSSDPAIYLRDSMLYRAESVGFHNDLLKVHFDGLTARANVDPVGIQDDRHFLYDCQRVFTFLSDDLLFNVISLFDYTANLVSFVLAGPNAHTRKWNGTVRALRDPNSLLNTTASAATMIQLHSEWVDKLHGSRSKIIHDRALLADGGRTLTFNNNTLRNTLHFQWPPAVVRRLRFLEHFSKEGKVDLIVGAEQIALRALDATIEVIKALRHDIDSGYRRKQTGP